MRAIGALLAACLVVLAAGCRKDEYYYSRHDGAVYQVKGSTVSHEWSWHNMQASEITSWKFKSEGQDRLGVATAGNWPAGGGMRMINAFVLEKNAAGSRDVVRLVTEMDFNSGAPPQTTFWERLLGRNENKEAMRKFLDQVGGALNTADGRVDSAWLRLPHRDVIQLIEAFKLDDPEAKELLAELRRRFPDDPALILFEIDLAVAAEDEQQLRRKLEEHRPALEARKDPFLDKAIKHYDRILKGHAAHREGRNLATRDAVGQLITPSFDMDEYLDRLTKVRRDDVYIPLNRPLLWADYPVPNFLERQVRTKVLRVMAEFQLLEGRPEEAIGLLEPAIIESTVILRHAPIVIEELISIAVLSVLNRGMETTYLEGMRTAEEIEAHWETLDRLVSEIQQACLDEQKPDVGEYEFAALNRSSFGEHDVRRNAMQSQALIARAAVAARHRLLVTGDYPDKEDDFSLLMQLPGADPFAEEAPLRFRLDDEKGFVVYSLGPDRQDGGAAVAYDPTNGTVSAGDIFTFVPRERTYPFPAPGGLADTRDGILAQFPNGLPPDPFADTRGRGYIVGDTTPPVIWSVGPDTDESRWRVDPLVPVDSGMPRPGVGVGQVGREYMLFHNPPTQRAYDPVNGIVSEGNLYHRPVE